MPVYYVIGLFILLVALFSLRYEITFLKTAKVGTFIWAVSVINFLTLAVLLLVLFLHHLMDKLFVIKAIVASLLVLFLVSAVQLVTRRRLFRTLELQLRDQRAEVIREMQDMIDEKKREKIREKYKKNGD
ncbi:MAG: hypothetical protein ABIG42_00040 [bacterium]